jgi:hypothetical protein
MTERVKPDRLTKKQDTVAHADLQLQTDWQSIVRVSIGKGIII